MPFLMYQLGSRWNTVSKGQVQRKPEEISVPWSILKESSTLQGEWVLPIPTGGVRVQRHEEKAHGELLRRKAAPL